MQDVFGDRVAIELTPSSGGCFEVDINGDRIYSKLEMGRFPRQEEIVELLRPRLTG